MLIKISLIFLIFHTCSAEYANQDVINLSVVACGDRVPETLVLLKSALMFTRKNLHFFIFTEANLASQFIETFDKWPKYIKNKFKYNIQEPKFPKENQEEWRKLFKLCASQRIFLPEILSSTDSLIYVDTDVLFLTDLEEIWNHFEKFNQTQLAALAPEHEEPNMGWYNRFARHPYYGKLGLNSGVMLMNLTRMREFDFVKKFYPLYQTYKYNITWGDQCLLNILFHSHPDKLYVYDCSWNYRPDHCMYGSNCKIAESTGARILHGCRRVFHNDKEPAFKKIYQIFEKYEFEEESMRQLLPAVKSAFEQELVKATYCGQAKDVFLITLEKQFNTHMQILKDAKFNYESNQSEQLIPSSEERQEL